MKDPWGPDCHYKTFPKWRSFVISALRKQWLSYPPRINFIKRTRFKHVFGTFKNGKPREQWAAVCAGCGETMKLSSMQVDHIEPAGSLLSLDDIGPFATRLFCHEDNMQWMCKKCHEIKSYADKYSISHEDALRGLEASPLRKLKVADLKAHLVDLGASEEDLRNKETREKFINKKFSITWL